MRSSYARSCLSAALTIALALPSSIVVAGEAQDVVQTELLKVAGTMDVAVQPQMSKGQLTGCVLTFDALQQDWVYLHGKFVKVSGSFGFMTSGGKTATVLKVVAAELDPEKTNLGGNLLAPTRSYLVGSDLSTNFSSLVAANRTDNEGLFSVFQMDPGAKIIADGLAANSVTIAFGLDGNSDIQVPVELDVVDVAADGTRKRSPQIVLRFIDCITKLLGN